MRKPQISLIITICMIFVLLVGTSLYATLRNRDPYRYFTGLGENISMAPDDTKFAFSYYVDGKESVYTANSNGSHVKKITNSDKRQERDPKYSPDGKKLVYLSKDSNGIQTLQMINADGSEERQLTSSKTHVRDAIFSHDGKTIYFVAMKAEEFKKGEESIEGFDLFSIKADGKQRKRLTNADYFSMNNLFLSSDGNTIYFSEFDVAKEQIYSYSLKKGTVSEKPSIISKSNYEFNVPKLSPDGKHLTFTEISKESKDSSLYNYELFLLDIERKNVERLTSLKKIVTSPVFFYRENKIAFLENTNWEEELAVYRLMTIDTETHTMNEVKLDAPKSAEDNRFMQLLDRSVNIYTIAILYILFMVLLNAYLLHYRNLSKPYLPSIISFAIAGITLVASFAVAAAGNPWGGIGLAMLAAGIFGCSVIIILFVYIYKRFIK